MLYAWCYFLDLDGIITNEHYDITSILHDVGVHAVDVITDFQTFKEGGEKYFLNIKANILNTVTYMNNNN